MPTLLHDFFFAWPALVAGLLVVVAGAGRGSARAIWVSVLAGAVLMIVWTVYESREMFVRYSAAHAAAEIVALFALGLALLLPTGAVSAALRRSQAGSLVRIAVPALFAVLGTASYPYLVMYVACMFGDCI